MARTKPRTAVGKRASRYDRARDASEGRAPGTDDGVRSDGRPDWRWRSFPVFAAFVAGMLLAFIVNGTTQNPVAFVVAVLAIMGCVYAAIHLFVMNVIVAGRVRRRQQAIARGETPPEDMEDVVVYDDADA